MRKDKLNGIQTAAYYEMKDRASKESVHRC